MELGKADSRSFTPASKIIILNYKYDTPLNGKFYVLSYDIV